MFAPTAYGLKLKVQSGKQLKERTYAGPLRMILKL